MTGTARALLNFAHKHAVYQSRGKTRVVGAWLGQSRTFSNAEDGTSHGVLFGQTLPIIGSKRGNRVSVNAIRTFACLAGPRTSSAPAGWRNFSSTPLALQQSSSSQRSRGKQSPPPIDPNAVAVPFNLTRNEARQKFDEYHNSGYLNTSRFVEVRKIEPVFLPFWVGTAEVLVRVVGGEIGFERMEPTYDFRTRRWTTQRVTAWESIDREFEWERRYDPAAKENGYLFQPATFDYPRRYISKLVNPSLIEMAKQFRPEMVDDKDHENPRGARSILPFETTPNVAVDVIEGLVTDKEKFEAENIVKRHYNADNVRLLQVQVQFTLFRLTPLYLPTYVFETEYLGNRFFSFVSAADGIASGQTYFSWERIALLSGAAGGLYALIAGLHKVFNATSIFWGFLVVPALIGAFASRYWPLGWQYVQAQWQDLERRRLRAKEARMGAGRSYENIGGYRREQEEERKRRDYEDEYQRSRAGGARASPGDVSDPKGYYKALGLKPDATKEEIQSAFRGLAMKGWWLLAFDRYWSELMNVLSTNRSPGPILGSQGQGSGQEAVPEA